MTVQHQVCLPLAEFLNTSTLTMAALGRKSVINPVNNKNPADRLTKNHRAKIRGFRFLSTGQTYRLLEKERELFCLDPGCPAKDTFRSQPHAEGAHPALPAVLPALPGLLYGAHALVAPSPSRWCHLDPTRSTPKSLTGHFSPQ